MSVPFSTDPLRASQGSVKETRQAVYYLISLTQSKRTANCLHRSAMPSNVGKVKKPHEMAAFIHLPKSLRPNIGRPDCFHCFQVCKGNPINLNCCSRSDFWPAGGRISHSTPFGPDEGRMPGEGRQSREAFTSSPGAHSLGGVSERGGGHSPYRPRHPQGGAPALILKFCKVCNRSQARAASPPGSAFPEPPLVTCARSFPRRRSPPPSRSHATRRSQAPGGGSDCA